MSIRAMQAVFDSSQQKAGHRLVLLTIANCANDDGVAWPSLDHLAAMCNATRGYVKDAIKALCSAGELEVITRTAVSGASRSNYYHILVPGAASSTYDPADYTSPATASPATPAQTRPPAQTPPPAATQPADSLREGGAGTPLGGGCRDTPGRGVQGHPGGGCRDTPYPTLDPRERATPLSGRAPAPQSPPAYACQQCQRVFRTRGALTLHLRRDHDGGHDSDAVTAYRRHTKCAPNQEQRAAITAAVADLPLWEEVLTEWMVHRWRPTNVANIIDRYQRLAKERATSISPTAVTADMIIRR